MAEENDGAWIPLEVAIERVVNRWQTAPVDDGSAANEPDPLPTIDDVYEELIEVRHEIRELRVLVEQILYRGAGPA